MRSTTQFLGECVVIFVVTAALTAGSLWIINGVFKGTRPEPVIIDHTVPKPTRPAMCDDLSGEEWRVCMGVGRR